ncbi:hypothetical protein [Urechidicola vernalis]|uniref:Uncharacterized protein n=1 Tax=Urechidicola vernalis TaxID=3075600 RepID=A0ABU2Y5V4_9FLAO|nr:hypothetical protein [Urechidicola sp. P050]MDT0553565.1 hypothetical protein [Urechidicola sp. P050]
MKTTRNYLFNPVIFALLALSTLMGFAQDKGNNAQEFSNSEVIQVSTLNDISPNRK